MGQRLGEGNGQIISGLSKESIFLITLITLEVVSLFKLNVLSDEQSSINVTLSLKFRLKNEETIFWRLLKSSDLWKGK